MWFFVSCYFTHILHMTWLVLILICCMKGTLNQIFSYHWCMVLVELVSVQQSNFLKISSQFWIILHTWFRKGGGHKFIFKLVWKRSLQYSDSSFPFRRAVNVQKVGQTCTFSQEMCYYGREPNITLLFSDLSMMEPTKVKLFSFFFFLFSHNYGLWVLLPQQQLIFKLCRTWNILDCSRYICICINGEGDLIFIFHLDRLNTN